MLQVFQARSEGVDPGYAFACIQMALTLFPELFESIQSDVYQIFHNWLSKISSSGRLEMGSAAFEQITSITRPCPQILYIFGKWLENHNHLVKSAQQQRTALMIDPTFIPSRNALERLSRKICDRLGSLFEIFEILSASQKLKFMKIINFLI